MKNKDIYLAFALLLFVSNSLFAEPVSKGAALLKARMFMPTKHFDDTKALARSKTTKEQDAYYVFNADGGGFVIVSGDDRTEEILGYSDSGNIDLDNLPDNARAWLEGYAKEIQSVGNIDTDRLITTRGETYPAVEPLIETRWNQGEPYNRMCPVSEGKNCVTGCVATAMAQIAYYHKCPKDLTPEVPAYTTGTLKINMPALSPIFFDWGKMKTEYSQGNYSLEEGDAVAQLMLYCGQTVKMNYTLYASAASVSSNIMIEYLGFSASATDVSRSDYSTADWEHLIYQELAENRPVLYRGYSFTGGHQFICDGYDGKGFFHINWGWGGHADGHFLLSVLNPGYKGIGGGTSSDGYSSGQGAIIGLKPSTGINKKPQFFIQGFGWRNNVQRNSTSEDFNWPVSGTIYTDNTNKELFKGELAFMLSGNGRQPLMIPLKENTTQAAQNDDRRWIASFGANLSDGDYILSLYLKTEETVWWNTKYLNWKANISGKDLTIKIETSPAKKDSITINSVSFNNAPLAGENTTATISIKNDGETFEQMLNIWLDDKAVSGGSAWIDPGYNGELNLIFRPEYSGKFKFAIGSPEKTIYNNDGTRTVTHDVYYSDSIIVSGNMSEPIKFPRKIVMEEATGTWCGWCVRGIETIERMKKEYPDNFIGIALHSGDEMANAKNYQPLTKRFHSWPNCFMNRRTKEAESVDLGSARSVVEKEKDNAIAKIEATAHYADNDSLFATISTETVFGFGSNDGDYRIAFVVLEDSVGPYMQNNAYSKLSQYDDPNNYMYEWVHKDAKTPVVYNDVARGIYGDVEGNKGSVPSSISVDTSYKYEYSILLPNNIVNKKNISIVALLIDNETGEIMNADQTKIISGNMSEPIKFPRKIVMEEATGTWCGWCVRGIETIERMKKEYPDNFIGIALHSGDEMANAKNYQPLTKRYSFWPGCFMNRRTKEAESVDLGSARSVVEKEKDNAIAKIEATAHYADNDSLFATISTETVFGFGSNDGDYRIAFVVLEDSVGPYMQNNAYSKLSQYDDPNNYMYEWVHKDAKTPVVYNDVARGIYGDVEGNKGSVPSSISVDTNYKYEYSILLPNNIVNKKNISIVALLIDNETGEIMNADQTNVIYDKELVEDQKFVFRYNGEALADDATLTFTAKSDQQWGLGEMSCDMGSDGAPSNGCIIAAKDKGIVGKASLEITKDELMAESLIWKIGTETIEMNGKSIETIDFKIGDDGFVAVDLLAVKIQSPGRMEAKLTVNIDNKIRSIYLVYECDRLNKKTFSGTLYTTISDAYSQPPIAGCVINRYVEGEIKEKGIIVSTKSDNLDYDVNSKEKIFGFSNLKDFVILDCTDIGKEQFWCPLLYLKSDQDYYVKAYVIDTDGNIVYGQTENIHSQSYKRYNGANDYANVFYYNEYTLFDLVTDEIISKEDGYYGSTNENPTNVVFKPNFMCYKFKTEWNYKLWYYHSSHCAQNKKVSIPLISYNDGKLYMEKNPVDADKDITIYYSINGDYFRPENFKEIYNNPIEISEPCIVYCYGISSDGYISYTNMYNVNMKQNQGNDENGDVANAIDLGLSVKWASWNLGADKPEGFGNYYSWGETMTKKDYSWNSYLWGNPPSKYNNSDGLMYLEASDDVVRSLWKDNWRMPTLEEEKELYSKCTWEYTQINGTNGFKVTGSNGNSIFLPYAGLYDGSGHLSFENSGGWYWSSERYDEFNAAGFYMIGTSVSVNITCHDRCDGHVIRPVYDAEPSSIINIYDNRKKKQVIYNINGQRLQNVQKGINIINGKKFVVK